MVVFSLPIKEHILMRIILQRVKSSSVSVAGKTVGRIGKGVMLLVGIHKDDTPDKVRFLASKCVDLRIFPDTEGKMNLSLKDVGGEILVVSQFTLYGDCSKGRRPSFIEAATPDKGLHLFNYFVELLLKENMIVETGIFGAMMNVELINDGPVTLILDK
jgi:D-tyrosyl-tRNA(Tyr) deacylase